MIPTCGPVTGYTQITVFGKNFLNMGFGKAKCVFNNTIYMNATIMEDNIIKCDSPPLPDMMGFSGERAPFYNISLTLNGKELSSSNLTFIYYIDPVLKYIHNKKGPIRGGTNSTLLSKGFR
jgi:IPT/TIG domain